MTNPNPYGKNVDAIAGTQRSDGRVRDIEITDDGAVHVHVDNAEDIGGGGTSTVPTFRSRIMQITGTEASPTTFDHTLEYPVWEAKSGSVFLSLNGPSGYVYEITEGNSYSIPGHLTNDGFAVTYWTSAGGVGLLHSSLT